eukprot:Phypoly_transcript_23976.p1 GENE.Phypoly_transcript_23976~~Phypoly_transcript_23976.p1  ORF type:complete len:129 (-),score=4.54 Phypoly_transcript_23976:79-465(-)
MWLKEMLLQTNWQVRDARIKESAISPLSITKGLTRGSCTIQSYAPRYEANSNVEVITKEHESEGVNKTVHRAVCSSFPTWWFSMEESIRMDCSKIADDLRHFDKELGDQGFIPTALKKLLKRASPLAP